LGTNCHDFPLIATYFGGKRTKQEFLKFDNSEINGIIKEIYIKHHCTGFKVGENNEDFVFYPYTSDLNDRKIFSHIAKPGDRLIKSQNSDTLILIANNKKYKYTFQRFDNK
jgi:hypothetical protein